MKICFLVSGELGINILKHFHKLLSIQFVMTDKSSQEIIDFCNLVELPLFVGNPRGGKARLFLKNKSCDVMTSVNYLFLIDKEIISTAKNLAFNIHGSLLPKYRGRTPHVWSIINNEKFTGITAHIIDEGCDTGDIIRQVTIPILECDTGSSIVVKYKELYKQLIHEVLERYSSNSIPLRKQDNTKATYFGKRTPDDGLIDWSWQRERIYNWVRAQSSPYPGAYSFYLNNKVIIDWIELDDYGFDYNIPNGTIVTNKPIRVKTPNGLVRLTELRSPINNIIENDKFDDI